MQDYKREGLEGLRPHYERSARNASKLTAAQLADECERLHQYRPDNVLASTVRLSQGQFWTVSDLHLALDAWYGVLYDAPGTYRDLFAACGFSDQRAERVYFPPGCPDLHPQQHVWKQNCQAIGHLWDYRHIGDLRKAFQAHLDNALFRFDWIAKSLPGIFYASLSL